MFRYAAGKLRFRPESGMAVIVFGRVSVYPRDGAYQLYCEAIIPEGSGDLQVAYEQLKAKLEAEGLFAKEHKKPIPRYPERIAIVTSSAGAGRPRHHPRAAPALARREAHTPARARAGGRGPAGNRCRDTLRERA